MVFPTVDGTNGWLFKHRTEQNFCLHTNSGHVALEPAELCHDSTWSWYFFDYYQRQDHNRI